MAAAGTILLLVLFYYLPHPATCPIEAMSGRRRASVRSSRHSSSARSSRFFAPPPPPPPPPSVWPRQGHSGSSWNRAGSRDRPAGKSRGRSSDRASDRPADRSADMSADRTADRSRDRSSLRSACRCSHFGIWAMLWASQSDGKAALRRDRPVETMRSRGLPSLPENRTVFSLACRNTLRFCAVGRNRRPFRGSRSPQWQSPMAQYRYAIF